MHDDLVAFADVGDGRADGVNPAGVLVSDGVRQLDAGLLGPLALEDVQVGAAHARPADLDDDVERTGGCGDGYLGHLEVLVVADNLDGAHGAHRSAPLGDVSADSGMKVGSYEASAASAPSDRWTWSRCEPG